MAGYSRPGTSRLKALRKSQCVWPKRITPFDAPTASLLALSLLESELVKGVADLQDLDSVLGRLEV